MNCFTKCLGLLLVKCLFIPWVYGQSTAPTLASFTTENSNQSTISFATQSTTRASALANAATTAGTNGSLQAGTANQSSTTTTASTAAPSITTPRKAEIQPEYHETTSGNFACPCDLTASLCDINCCCDFECTDTDRQAFSECADRWLNNRNQRYCVPQSLIIRNHTEYTAEYSDNGLLCIVHDNLRQRLVYETPELVTSEEAFNYYHQLHGGNEYYYNDLQEPELPYAEAYQAGDQILATGDNGAITTLPIPQAVLTDECSYTTPAEFFVDKTTSCFHKIDFEQLEIQCGSDPVINPDFYANRLKLFKLPKGFLPTTHSNQEDVAESMQPISALLENVGLNRNISEVFETNDTRHTINQTISAIAGSNIETTAATVSLRALNEHLPKPTFTKSDNVCHDVVTEAHYVITVSETLSILSATVRLGIGRITEEQNVLKQSFSISFRWWNQSKAPIFKRSGNSGYLTGEPILAGETAVENQTIMAVQLSTDRQNWLTLVKSDATTRLCVIPVNASTTRTPILFGYNMLSGCLLELSTNATLADCRLLQQQALNILRGPRRDVVGAYGNASVNNIKDWVPILFENNATTQDISSSARGSCSNIILGMDIQIIHAKTGSMENAQEKILGVKYQLKPGQDISTTCFNPNCKRETKDRVPVAASVTFIDVSQPAEPSIAKIPIIDARLPNDFFYPFTGLSQSNEARQSGGKLQLHTIVLTLFLCLVRGF